MTPRRFYLVERYAPDGDLRSVAAATQRGTASGDGTRHVGTVVMATEDTCLSVFEAEDAGAVAAANEAAGLPPARIVEAEWFPSTST